MNTTATNLLDSYREAVEWICNCDIRVWKLIRYRISCGKAYDVIASEFKCPPLSVRIIACQAPFDDLDNYYLPGSPDENAQRCEMDWFVEPDEVLAGIFYEILKDGDTLQDLISEFSCKLKFVISEYERFNQVKIDPYVVGREIYGCKIPISECDRLNQLEIAPYAI